MSAWSGTRPGTRAAGSACRRDGVLVIEARRALAIDLGQRRPMASRTIKLLKRLNQALITSSICGYSSRWARWSWITLRQETSRVGSGATTPSGDGSRQPLRDWFAVMDYR